MNVRALFFCCFGIAPLAAAQEAAVLESDAPAWLDDEEAGEVVRLDPITTVATRTPRGTFDTPASIAQVGQQEIERWQASDLAQTLKGLAGISLAGGPRANGTAINIRGLSGTRVLMAVDGARQNFDGAHRSRLNVDPDLLKSVEVLRGPGSALWGSDALGGVVSVATRDAADLLRPGQRLGLRLKTGFESANDEQLGGLTAFGRAGSLDWLSHATLRDTGDLRLGGGERLPHSALDADSQLHKSRWSPADGHDLGLSFQRFLQTGATPSNPTQDVTDTNPLLDRRNDQRYLGARYGYSGDGRLSAAQFSAYRSALGIVEDRVDQARHDTLDFVTQGYSAQASLAFAALSQRLSLGLETYTDESSATRNGAPRPQFPDARREVLGTYLQDEIGLGRGWSLIPGLRYDRVEARSNTQAADRTREDRHSLKLGTAYELTEWLALHAAYAEAFRAPSLLETYAAGTHFLGNEFRPNPDLRPEDAVNLEAGLRLHFGDLLQIKLTAYDNDIDNYIETIVAVESQVGAPQCAPPQPAVGCVNRNEDGSANMLVPPVYVGGYTTSENLRKARIRGIELESAYRHAGFELGLAYSLARGENAESGEPLLSIPADTAHSTVGYRWGALQLGLRVSHARAQNRVPLDTEGAPVIPRTSAYTVTDAFVGWEPAAAPLRGLRLNLGADNLGDRAHRNHLSALPEAGFNPRVSLSYQF